MTPARGGELRVDDEQTRGTTMRLAARLTGVGLCCLVLALTAACGGDDKPASGVSGDGSSATARSDESTSSSPSSAPSASGSASASPSKAALSEYEDEPSVQGARAWTKAIAQDVNNKDANYSLARRLSTQRAQGKLESYEGSDLRAGLRMPGPIPFTPVQVRASAGQATLDVCLWAKGWGRDPATGKPAETKSIVGAGFDMIKDDSGVWQVNALYLSNSVQCGDVIVKGVRS